MRRSTTIALALLLSPVSLADGAHKSRVDGHVRPQEQHYHPTVDTDRSDRPEAMFVELLLENETARWVRVEVDGHPMTWLAPGEQDLLRVSNEASRVQTFVGDLEITTDIVRPPGPRHRSRQSITVTPPTVGKIEFTNNKRYSVMVYVDGQSLARVRPMETVSIPARVGVRRVVVVELDGRHIGRRHIMEERLVVGSYEPVELETAHSRRSRADRRRR